MSEANCSPAELGYPAPQNPDSLNYLLDIYMKTRDKRAAIKRVFEEEDNKLKKLHGAIEVKLMQMMKDIGTDNLKVDGLAMAYLTPKTFVSAKDWDAVWDYIEKSGNVSLLQRRLSEKAVKEYMEANGGDLPPGVDVHTERTVVVRTA